ncbi:hypothetical protein CEXT_445001 [Caerostris extrusa]|uniref:Uncharacterized protein n=1 Tax=Caerostris extrusa TaxID=172846 RepID=A0AAV4UNL1_CAEEX|nr:hypothetical protein CEXT_445001 [Caerostris extrusa]
MDDGVLSKLWWYPCCVMQQIHGSFEFATQAIDGEKAIHSILDLMEPKVGVDQSMVCNQALYWGSANDNHSSPGRKGSLRIAGEFIWWLSL